MGLISSKLRSVVNGDGDKGIAYYCPGCERVHVVWYQGKVAWEWNGDAEKPTINPSIRIYQPAVKNAAGEMIEEEVTECHCFVRDGVIQFLSDCTHEQAGKNVPIPDWPYARGAYGGIDE